MMPDFLVLGSQENAMLVWVILLIIAGAALVGLVERLMDRRKSKKKK
jgi:hypothetical protein